MATKALTTFRLSKVLFETSKQAQVRFFGVTTTAKTRYVQYIPPNGGQPHIGAQLECGGDIIDVSRVDTSIPNTLVKFLNSGQEVRDKAKR